MINAFFKACFQLKDKNILQLLLSVFAATAGLYLILLGCLWVGLSNTALFETGWLESISDWFGGGVAVILSLVFFPAMSLLVLSFFLEKIADAVEAKHYPELPDVRGQPIVEVFAGTVKFMMTTLLVNLVLLPLWLIPGANIPLFYGINGYLIGREYFELVAVRRIPLKEACALRRKHRMTFILAGALIVFLKTIPVVNFIAPVIAVAAIVHLFQKVRPA